MSKTVSSKCTTGEHYSRQNGGKAPAVSGASRGARWRASGRVAHVARAEISPKPLSLTAPASGFYVSGTELQPGYGELSTCR